MARSLRIQYPGAYYHVSSRGNEQQDIFKSRRDREKFLDYLLSATQRYGARIHCYCLMSNHYHLLIETPEGNLSQIMQHINGSYTTYYNFKHERAGHLFQGRYHAVLVEADSYALELSRYVHLNPVRAGISQRPEAYPWSSYSIYIGERTPPEWLHTTTLLAFINADRTKACSRYQQFVQDKLSSGKPSPLHKAAAGIILGHDAFVENIRRTYLGPARRKQDRNLPAIGVLTRRCSSERILATVASQVAEKKLARKIGIYLCHRYSGEKLQSLGARFGLSESGISQTSRRLEQQAAGNRAVRRHLDEIQEKLGLCKV